MPEQQNDTVAPEDPVISEPAPGETVTPAVPESDPVPGAGNGFRDVELSMVERIERIEKLLELDS